MFKTLFCRMDPKSVAILKKPSNIVDLFTTDQRHFVNFLIPNFTDAHIDWHRLRSALQSTVSEYLF